MVTGRFAAEGKEREELKEIHLKGHIKPVDSSLPPRHFFFSCVNAWPSNPRTLPQLKEVESALLACTPFSLANRRPKNELTRKTAAKNGYMRRQLLQHHGPFLPGHRQLDVAVMYFEQVVNIARREGSREEGTGLVTWGRVYTALGYIDRAIEFHEEHLTIAHQLRIGQEGLALGNLGRAYRQSWN